MIGNITSIKMTHYGGFQNRKPLQKSWRNESLQHDNHHLWSWNLLLGESSCSTGNLLTTFLSSNQGSNQVNYPIKDKSFNRDAYNCGLLIIQTKNKILTFTIIGGSGIPPHPLHTWHKSLLDTRDGRIPNQFQGIKDKYHTFSFWYFYTAGNLYVLCGIVYVGAVVNNNIFRCDSISRKDLCQSVCH